MLTVRERWTERRVRNMRGQVSAPANCPRKRARAAAPRHARSASALMRHWADSMLR